jgi:Glycosyltransferase family 87
VAGSLRALKNVLEVAALLIAPAVLTLLVLAMAVHEHYAFDFRGSLWQAARDVLHFQNPYPPATEAGVAVGNQFVYPPPIAMLFVPFGLLPFPVAAALITVVLLAAVALTLAALGVRDWRCYGATYLSIAVIHDIRLGAITPLLALGLALTWRWRDQARSAITFALIVVAKLFLWPLVFWLVATGRARVAVRGATLAIGVTVAAWAAIGFAGLVEYPTLLRVLAEVEDPRGYSVIAGSLWLGASPLAAEVIAAIVGTGLLALCWLEGQRGNDQRSLTIALAASLALSPIVWLHYFILVVVPIALARRTFSPLWLVPALFWITPYEEHFGEHWRIAVGLGVATLAFAGSRGAAHRAAALSTDSPAVATGSAAFAQT